MPEKTGEACRRCWKIPVCGSETGLNILPEQENQQDITSSDILLVFN